jgi:tetratricopeptide (TPR) repeat protein
MVAHHWSKAGIHDKAGRHFAEAAERARGAYANGEAIAFYRAAVQEIQKVLRATGGGDSTWREMLPRMYESLGDMCALTGQQEKARHTYAAALKALPGEGRIWCGRLHRKIGKTWETHHQHKKALAAYARAEACLGASPLERGAVDPSGLRGEETEAAWWREWVEIQNDRFFIHYWLAEGEEMAALVERVRPVVERWGSPLQRAHFYDNLAHLDERRGRYRVSAETVRFAREAKRAAEEAQDLATVAYEWFALAFALLFYGALDEAEGELRGALAEAERIGDRTLLSRCLNYMMMIHRRRRAVEQTRQWAVRSLAVARETRMVDYVGAARANLAWVAWCQGDLATAREEGQAACERWQKLALVYPYPMQWMGLWVLVALALEQGDVGEAVRHAHAMLDAKQERLAGEVTVILEQAVAAAERGEMEVTSGLLRRAAEVAEEHGYL